MRLVLPMAASVCLPAASAFGQAPVWQWHHEYPHVPMGTLRPAGDVDADGAEDFLTIARIGVVRGWFYFWDKQVQVRSGRHGWLLRTGPTAAEIGEEVTGYADMGDVDQDGAVDGAAMIARFGSSVVTVQSWRTGATLWQVQILGGTTGLLGIDIVGDTRRELIVVAGDAVHAFDANGTTLYRVPSPPGFWLGEPADAGDRDGDGAADFLLGSHSAGLCTLVKGNNGQVLRTWLRPGHTLAQPFTGLGDLDGDGRDEFAIAFSGAAPAVTELRSGASSLVLQQWPERAVAMTGGLDLDRDGHPDLALVLEPAGTLGQGQLLCYSQRHGELAFTMTSVGATSALALATGNGESLLALTTRGMSSMIGGWRGVLGTPPATTLGNGCASVGTPPRSSLHGIVPPDWARLTLADAPPGAFASVVVDLRPRVPAPAPIALDPWGLTGCSLYALPQLVCPHMVDATGYASQVLPRTVVAPTAGLGSVHAQWVLFWFGPQGIEHAVTQALALVTI